MSLPAGALGGFFCGFGGGLLFALAAGFFFAAFFAVAKLYLPSARIAMADYAAVFNDPVLLNLSLAVGAYVIHALPPVELGGPHGAARLD